MIHEKQTTETHHVHVCAVRVYVCTVCVCVCVYSVCVFVCVCVCVAVLAALLAERHELSECVPAAVRQHQAEMLRQLRQHTRQILSRILLRYDLRRHRSRVSQSLIGW